MKCLLVINSAKSMESYAIFGIIWKLIKPCLVVIVKPKIIYILVNFSILLLDFNCWNFFGVFRLWKILNYEKGTWGIFKALYFVKLPQLVPRLTRPYHLKRQIKKFQWVLCFCLELFWFIVGIIWFGCFINGSKWLHNWEIPSKHAMLEKIIVCNCKLCCIFQSRKS